MEETERSPVNFMILLLSPAPTPHQLLLGQFHLPAVSSPSVRESAYFIKEWLPGFPSGPVNIRSAATWGWAQISGEWWDGGGTTSSSRLRWFWVYKGSQRLENHRCQKSSRPYPLKNLQ